MHKPLLIKFFLMSAIALLLLIPLTMIHSLIMERDAYRDSVIDDIANSTSRAQSLTGPILVVPYTKTLTEWRKIKDDTAAVPVTTEREGQLFFLPERLKAGLQLQTEQRSRGIYQSTLYRAAITMDGNFKLPKNYGIGDDLKAYRFHAPFLLLGISDVRGIKSPLHVSFAGQNVTALPGTQSTAFTSGVHVPVLRGARQPASDETYAVALSFTLQGSAGLSILQLGEQSEINMTADWPHPSFRGKYLPGSHEISDEGFSANWYSSHFANNIRQSLSGCALHGYCDDLIASAAQVELIDPVDQYVKSDRAIKYALLFICLTFAVFFLFEILKQLRIHPVQYLLVGVSLAAFYMLLISLAEHIGFTYAYLASALACISLIGFYLVHILHSALRALLFASGLGLLYALLFGVLDSEDYALLMGTILLFAVLSLFMIATRKLDWYTAAALEIPQERSQNGT